MSIFGTIMSKIFGKDHPAAQTPPTGGSSPDAPPTAPASPPEAPGTSTSSAPPASGGAAPAGGQAVDVNAVLEGMAAKAGQKLNWKVSIVDLMKLLGMDSSLTARKQLAHELGYTGDTNDSATMNIWLHKQVVAKFAEAGGKLPPDLQH